MGRGRRRNDAVGTPVTNKAQCITHRPPTLPQPAPDTDAIMRTLFGGPPKAVMTHASKETK